MNLQQIKQTVAKIRYKPNHKITVDEFHSESGILAGHARILFEYTWPDRETGEPTEFWVASVINPAKLHEKLLLEMIFYRLQDLEKHECAEMFYYDNKRVFDPHV